MVPRIFEQCVKIFTNKVFWSEILIFTGASLAVIISVSCFIRMVKIILKRRSAGNYPKGQAFELIPSSTHPSQQRNGSPFRTAEQFAPHSSTSLETLDDEIQQESFHQIGKIQEAYTFSSSSSSSPWDTCPSCVPTLVSENSGDSSCKSEATIEPRKIKRVSDSVAKLNPCERHGSGNVFDVNPLRCKDLPPLRLNGSVNQEEHQKDIQDWINNVQSESGEIPLHLSSHITERNHGWPQNGEANSTMKISSELGLADKLRITHHLGKDNSQSEWLPGMPEEAGTVRQLAVTERSNGTFEGKNKRKAKETLPNFRDEDEGSMEANKRLRLRE